MTIATDTIRVLTVDKRAGFLLELAEHVETESRWAQRPFTDVVLGIVPATASAFCVDPLAAFDRLVSAIAEKREYDGDPGGYANAHDWSTCETALDQLHDRLQSNIDAALQELLNPTAVSA